MPETVGAAAQLERISYILPRAAREGGATLAELSDALGVEAGVVLRDLTQVTARAYYQPAGGDDLRLEIEGDRVSLWTPAAFDRPVRLSMPEAVCLGLALRGRLAGRGGRRTDAEVEPGTLRFLKSLETTLSTIPTEEVLARIEAADLRPDPAGIREILSLALEGREELCLQYLKPGDEAHPTGERFPAPEDFDPETHIQGGRVFRADQKMDVKVRYSPRVARWIVRHVLQYGAEAEVLEPEEVRGWVRGVVARVGDSD